VAAALDARDVDGAVALFTEGATVRSVSLSQTFVGSDQIRNWMQTLVDDHAWVMYDNAPSSVEGGHVIWTQQISTDTLRNLGAAPVGVTVDVTVADGRVQNWNAEFTPEAQARINAGAQATQIVSQFFDAINRGDLAATLGFISDDIQVASSFGDRVNGKSEAEAFYSRLIATHSAFPIFGSPQVAGDRVTLSYGVSNDAIRAAGLPDAESIGYFYVRNGKITFIDARPTPNGQAILQAAAQ
jgi:ketosteroid isomerase-like protein